MMQPDIKWTNRQLGNIGQGIVYIGDDDEDGVRESTDTGTDSSA